MRHPRKLTNTLALAGLAVFTASAAQAGLQNVCTTCAGQPESPRKATIHAKLHAKARKTGHLCAACASKMKNGMRMPATVASTGPCATCNDGGGAILAASDSTPGYAVIGDGSPAPLMAASGVGGNAPGYAIIGGTMASAEPAPIGVMRTNYNSGQDAQGTLGASLPHQQGGAPGVNGIPFAHPSEVPASLYAPQPRRRHSVVARMIGLPDFGRGRAEAEGRKRDAHAQTAYGPSNTTPSELPASMVYGGR